MTPGPSLRSILLNMRRPSLPASQRWRSASPAPHEIRPFPAPAHESRLKRQNRERRRMETPYGFPQYVIDRVLAKRGRLAVFDRFDPKRTALLVVDMQNFYVGEIASVIGIIPNINRIAKELRARGGCVIWLGMT